MHSRNIQVENVLCIDICEVSFENHRRERSRRGKMVARSEIEPGQNYCGGALVSWGGFANTVEG